MDKSTEAAYYRLSMQIAGDLTGTIGIPAVIAGLLGKYLDGRYGTYPRFLVLFLVFAFLLSSHAVYTKVKKYGKAYEALTNKSKPETRV